MALKILIVDPDEAWTGSATKYFRDLGYQVASVFNGRDAQSAMYNEKFFAVIMNYATENHSAQQVLKFIKSNQTNVQTIIIFNNNNPIERGEISEEKLIKMGVAEIVIKPFELSTLKDMLEGHQSVSDLVANIPKREGQSEEEEVAQSDNQFTKIRIEEFYSSQAVLFDIYIKLAENKYLKILHAGDLFTKERLDRYKIEKKVEFLYFANSDRRKFIQYNNFLSKKSIENQNIPSFVKVGLLKNTTEKFVEEIYTVGVKPLVIDQGKEVCETVFQLIESQTDLYSVLKSFQKFDPSAYSHAFLVTLYSTAIIKQFEWQSKTTIETTAMACMFHDIGKMQLPKEFINLSAKKMNPEQLIEYQKHPELGYRMVENNRALNNSVKQMILQHHETFNGTGFPSQKKGSKILTLANIICLVDDFVHVMIDDELQPTDALKRILMNKEQVSRYNSILIENFIRVFVDPAKIKKEANVMPSNSRVVNSRRAS